MRPRRIPGTRRNNINPVEAYLIKQELHDFSQGFRCDSFSPPVFADRIGYFHRTGVFPDVGGGKGSDDFSGILHYDGPAVPFRVFIPLNEVHDQRFGIGNAFVVFPGEEPADIGIRCDVLIEIRRVGQLKTPQDQLLGFQLYGSAVVHDRTPPGLSFQRMPREV